MAKEEFLKVRIVTPKGEVFNGQAISVSSENSAGRFDVLPEHANFVTLIENKVIRVVKIDKTILEFKYPLAILSNSNNNVNIYTDIF